MGYLKFIAIRQDIRSKGYGSLLLQEVVDQVRQDGIRQTGWPYIGVVFEVERPEDAPDETQRELREKRIRFYEGNGARLLEGVDYIAPPVAFDQPPLPFHLMARATTLKRLKGRRIRQMMIENVLLAGYGESPESPFVRHALEEQ